MPQIKIRRVPRCIFIHVSCLTISLILGVSFGSYCSIFLFSVYFFAFFCVRFLPLVSWNPFEVCYQSQSLLFGHWNSVSLLVIFCSLSNLYIIWQWFSSCSKIEVELHFVILFLYLISYYVWISVADFQVNSLDLNNL